MTNSEFSNTFDTLLNSYNTQAMFGDQASKLEVVLDEYEKSVLLTQAQDIIVKQYFDVRTDGVQEGFDGSERRQLDFSSLVTVKTLSQINATSQNVSVKDTQNGILGTLRFTLNTAALTYKPYWEVYLVVHDSGSSTVELAPSEEDPTNTFVVTVHMTIDDLSDGTQPNLDSVKALWDTMNLPSEGLPNGPLNVYISLDVVYTTGQIISTAEGLAVAHLKEWEDTDSFDDRGIMFNLPANLLFMLNEKLEVINGNQKKNYVVIPINYKEYDRQNSKPYSQPYKKQCWRLFQNIQGFDTLSEVIPIWDATNANSDIKYKIRYVRRPRPIVLVNLTDGLEIDGEVEASECELNPIIHMDILNKAVELAIIYKGNRPVSNNKRED